MASHPAILAESSYPLLNAFWTMLWLFLWVLWFFLLFRIIGDVFRSTDLSGWAKAGWSLFVIILPFLGVFTYLIVRGSTIQQRDAAQAKAVDDAFRTYAARTLNPQAGGATGSAADELTKLSALHDRGVLSDAEFNTQKTKILA